MNVVQIEPIKVNHREVRSWVSVANRADVMVMLFRYHQYRAVCGPEQLHFICRYNLYGPVFTKFGHVNFMNDGPNQIAISNDVNSVQGISTVSTQ